MRNVRRAWRIASAMSRRSSASTTTSAVHCASGVALPRLTDTCACASDGASLMPSPTIATTAPSACSASDRGALVLRQSRRRAHPRYPGASPTAATADARSPDRIAGTMRSSFRRATRPRAPARTRVADREHRDEAAGVAERDQRRRPRRSHRRVRAVLPDSAPTKSGRPRRTDVPATTPSTPWPATTCEMLGARPLAVPSPPPRNACASGCSDVASSAAASAMHLVPRVAALRLHVDELPRVPASTCRSCRRRHASPRKRLERIAARHDDLPARERAGRRRERRRRGERQRARAGNDQHGKGDRERTRRVVEPPDSGRERGQREQRADEPGGGPIGDTRDPRPRRKPRERRAARSPRGGSPRRPRRRERRAHRRERCCPQAPARRQLARRGRDSPVRIASSTFAHRRRSFRPQGPSRRRAPARNRPPRASAAAMVTASLPHGPVDEPFGGRRARAGHGLDRVARPSARDELDVARHEQQRDEHRHRVVVDAPRARCGRHGARRERGREAERDRHVHAEAAAGEGRATRRGRTAPRNREAQAA